jgi:hypothetical protein
MASRDTNTDTGGATRRATTPDDTTATRCDTTSSVIVSPDVAASRDTTQIAIGDRLAGASGDQHVVITAVFSLGRHHRTRSKR